MEKFGVICVGYQGIGKSTLANKYQKYLDLESGNFWIGRVRHEDWYVTYATIAMHLASQGHVVFVSSHKEVRDYLNSVPLPHNVYLMCCVPSPELKDEWIKKLHDRFESSNLEKDYKAWKNAEDRYLDNIQEIRNSFDIVCELDSMDYELIIEIQDVLGQHGLHIHLSC